MCRFALLLIAGVTCLLLAPGKASILTDKEIELLKNSPFVPIGSKDEHQSPARGLSETIMKLKEHCGCNNLVCGCCTKVGYGFMSIKACINFAYDPSNKLFSAYVKVAGSNLYSKSFPVQGIEDACNKNIGGVDELDFCMTATVDEGPDNNGMTVCTHFTLKYAEIPVLKLHLHCFAFNGKELSVAENENAANNDSLFNFEIKQPFELISKLIMKLVDKIKSTV